MTSNSKTSHQFVLSRNEQVYICEESLRAFLEKKIILKS